MENNNINLLTYTGAYWEGKLYCLARDFNLLFSVDLQDGKTELIDSIPENDILINFRCGIMTVWNGKLILTPNNSKKIWIYDLVSGQWDNITVKDCDHCYDTGSFFQAYVYHDKIFLIGGGYPAILCLNLKNNSCNYVKEPYKDMINRHPKLNYLYFWYYGVQVGNMLYLASCLDNYVLKFDMDTLEYHWNKVGDDSDTYWGITWDGNNFWLLQRSCNNIVNWDGQKNITRFPLPSDLKQYTEYIWGICYNGQQIALPAINHTNTILVNPQNNTLQIQKQRYSIYSQLNNGMVVSQTPDANLSVITNGTTPKNYHITIDINQLKQFYEEKGLPIFKGQTLYHETSENPMLSLESFLSFTKSQAENNPSGGQIGKTIWDSIK